MLIIFIHQQKIFESAACRTEFVYDKPNRTNQPWSANVASSFEY